MPLARSLKELVLQRLGAEPAFAQALPREGVETVLTGDVDAGKAISRDNTRATIGFARLGEAVGTQPETLVRMFGPCGKPQARNLFGVIGYLQRQAGVASRVTQEPT